MSRNDARDDARREMLSWSDHRPACPRCGDLLEVGARYCPECGCPVAVDRSVESVDRPNGLTRRSAHMNDHALSRSELLEHIAATVRWLRSWGLTADEIREAVAAALDRERPEDIASAT